MESTKDTVEATKPFLVPAQKPRFLQYKLPSWYNAVLCPPLSSTLPKATGFA